jgi:hypothetical protein
MEVPMSNELRWQTWSLTADGWKSSALSNTATDAVSHRTPDTVLSLLYCFHETGREPTVSTIFRSPDNHAVAAAIAKHGARPSH